MPRNRVLWAGPMETKLIEDMTRDELIEALYDTAEMLASYQTPAHSRAYGLGCAEMFRRGEKVY